MLNVSPLFYIGHDALKQKNMILISLQKKDDVTMKMKEGCQGSGRHRYVRDTHAQT